jgi:hypothetical protein
MPFQVTEFQETPNPNAVKCILDRSPVEQPRSFFNAQDAASDPIASRLFAIPGVTNVLMHVGWVTVSKDPKSTWKSVKPAVERALREVP